MDYLALIVLPWLAATAITPLVIRASTAVGFLDRPHGRKGHERPVAYGGGLVVLTAVLVGVAGASFLLPNLHSVLWISGGLGPFCLGLVAMTLLGTIDDARPVRARYKFGAQVAIAAATWFAGFQIGEIELPFGWTIVDHPLPSFLLTLGWVVVITNAFNLIDGMDGLSTGIGVIAMLSICVLASENLRPVAFAGAMLLAGSLAGFLRFNLPSARIFQGDGGALAIGYGAAVLSLASYQKSSTAMVVVVPLLAVAVPLVDTGLAILRRTLGHLNEHGMAGIHPASIVKALSRPDRAHVHHLLLRSGLSVSKALVVLYGISVSLAAIAILAEASSTRWAILAGSLGAGVVGLRVLERRVDRFEAARSAATEPAAAPVAHAEPVPAQRAS